MKDVVAEQVFAVVGLPPLKNLLTQLIDHGVLIYV
jgi:hypothetical protein